MPNYCRTAICFADEDICNKARRILRGQDGTPSLQNVVPQPTGLDVPATSEESLATTLYLASLDPAKRRKVERTLGVRKAMLVRSNYDIGRDIFYTVRDLWRRAYWALHPESTRRPERIPTIMDEVARGNVQCALLDANIVITDDELPNDRIESIEEAVRVTLAIVDAMTKTGTPTMTASLVEYQGFPQDVPPNIVTLGECLVRNVIEYGVSNWYNWRLENWGVKWDIETDDEFNVYPNRILVTTPWAPPIEAMRALAKRLGTDIALYYDDEQFGVVTGLIVISASGNVISDEGVPWMSTRDAFLIASFVSDYDQEDYRYDPKTDSVVTRWETEEDDYDGPDIDSLPVINYNQMPHPDWYGI